MPDQRADLVRRMIAEGTSDEDILATLKVYDARQQAKPTAAADIPHASMMGPSGMAGMTDVSPVLRFAKAHPAQAGAIAAGALAAPFTGGMSLGAGASLMGLMSAGGAGYGLAAEQLATGRPKPVADSIKTMATEAALGATGEGAGRGIAAGLTKIAPSLYKRALRPSMALQRDFGDVSKTGLDAGVRVSDAGATKAEQLLSASGNQGRQMVHDAAATGAPYVATHEVAQELAPVMQQGQRQAQLGRTDPRPDVVDRLVNFQLRNAGGIPLAEAQQLKTEAQDLATKAYRAHALGAPVNDLSAASDEAMARGLRKAIEARVPGVKDVNSRTQDLIGLSRALDDAGMRSPSALTWRSVFGGPAARSGMAIGAKKAAESVPFGQMLRAALIAALGDQ